MTNLLSQTQLLPNEKNGPSVLREKILELEAAMLAMKEHQIHIEPKHYFAPGIYMREITIPKDVTLTGKIHKTEHYCILAQGEVSVRTENGIVRLKAPAVVHSLPGMKRVLFAHEESMWINVHHNSTNEQDLERVDQTFVTDSFEEYYLESKRTLDDVVKALGTSHQEMTAVSERLDDQIEILSDGIRIGDSSVHGQGVFATRRFEKGEIIAQARIGGKRAPAGRFCNHGPSANAAMVMSAQGDVDLVALKEIEAGTEILSDYYLNFTNTRVLIQGGK